MSPTGGRQDTLPRRFDGLPLLDRGAHRSPQRGACLMEYVSVLAGERFSDHPRCTHPALAQLARWVNDQTIDPAARAQLAVLAPDLIGTRASDPRITRTITACCLRAAVALRPHDRDLTQVLRRIEAQLSRWSTPRARHRARWLSFVWEPQTAAAIATLQRVMKPTRANAARHDAQLRTLLEHAITDCRILLWSPPSPPGRAPAPAGCTRGPGALREG